MIAQTRRISAIALASIWCLTIISGSSLSVNAQQPDSNRLPILLIHGYGENSNIWNSWRGWLGGDHFSKVYPITLQDDECGSAQQHATELKNIIDRILSETGYEKVNIVAHSKGGLDARWYIASSSIDKVANLIMIGTPNAGSPAALWDFTGCPFGSDSDLFPGSPATQVVDRPQSTNYYTIAGNWLPNNLCPIGLLWIPNGGNCFIPGPDDGLVAVYSVKSSPEYIPLGTFPYYHTDLVKQRDVYERALPILDR
jgi:pimeloyl-ACP methyl ester carboxylesterase